MAYRIGCSGFLYEHWRRRFYPPSARGEELEFYARSFDTVELNVTFYRMPSAATFRAWGRRVPDEFEFAVKASRYVTHIRRLRDTADSVHRFVERVAELGPHLGPILVQLPPDLPLDLDGLVTTLEAFPRSFRVAVEPRHDSWFVEPVRDVLAERGAALCLADRRGPITPLWQTADWEYVRFHAGRGRPPSCYGERALDVWAERLAARPPATHGTGYAFFNNDGHGCALRDAERFGTALAVRGVPVARIPDVPADVVAPRSAAGDGRGPLGAAPRGATPR